MMRQSIPGRISRCGLILASGFATLCALPILFSTAGGPVSAESEAPRLLPESLMASALPLPLPEDDVEPPGLAAASWNPREFAPPPQAKVLRDEPLPLVDERPLFVSFQRLPPVQAH